MEVFKLHKPKSLGLEHWRRFIDSLIYNRKTREEVEQYIEGTTIPEYLYWDKVRYKPHPQDITAEDFWEAVKFLRQISPTRVKTVVRDTNDKLFRWQSYPGLDHFLHEVDLQLGGMLESSRIDDPVVRRRFISKGIMEEAIASSQLEGASTTRKAAKQMLIEKRPPRNHSEQMILNNYHAMVHVENVLKDRMLTLDTLLELHRMLVLDTVDSADAGRFRRDDENVVVCDTSSNLIYHIPPPVDFLKVEIERFIQYANDELADRHFVHPVIKAIILHFWLAYLHPFTDGNGRLARTIFYWYLLRKKYWAFSYLPVSRVIRNSPAQYRDAYIYTEQDDNDLTYFIDYNVRKLRQAKREFEEYVVRKERENRRMTEISRSSYNFNDRQIQLLKYLYKNSSATTTIKTHADIYSVSRVTARKDLEELEQQGFLSSTKVGRDRPFSGTEKIAQLFG